MNDVKSRSNFAYSLKIRIGYKFILADPVHHSTFPWQTSKINEPFFLVGIEGLDTFTYAKALYEHAQQTTENRKRSDMELQEIVTADNAKYKID